MNKRNDNIPDNSNPFVTPDKYFDTLSDRIMDKIEQEEINKHKTIFRFIKPILSMAASFTIIFFLIYYTVRTVNPKLTEQSTTIETNYMDFEFYNDQTIFAAMEDEPNDEYDEAMVETFLLASVSEIELIELN